MHYPPELSIGDIVLSYGTWKGSEIIAEWTREPGQSRIFSHCEIVVAGLPFPLLVGAVPPVVRVIPLQQALLTVRDAVLVHSKNLSDQEREIVVAGAIRFIGVPYPFHQYFKLGADILFKTDFFGGISLGKRFAVCSVLAGYCYDLVNKDWGEKSSGLTPNEIYCFSDRRSDVISLHDLLPYPTA